MLTGTLSKPMDTDMITINQSAKASGNLQKVKGLSKTAMLQKIDEVSQDFEAEYISQMLGSMFSTVDSKDSLGGSDEEDQYKSLLIDQYGKIIARNGGIGVADQVKREMLKLQEVEPDHAS